MTHGTAWPFVKMHGLGNDFVVLDARSRALTLTPERIRAVSDRRTGIGCDQLVVIAPPNGQVSDATMLIYNSDGSEVAACGNATRCVAWLLMTESGAESAVIETRAGLLDAESRGAQLVAVDMGRPGLDWREIPLAQAVDTLHLGIKVGALTDPVGVSMGNPHAVFFVNDAEAVELSTVGPVLEHHALFPERANIEVAQMLSSPDAALGRIRMRVWERGTGITMACGTGACATLVAAARRGLSPRKAEIVLDGGTLTIEWLPDNHVLMTGPVATSFAGTLDPTLLP
ncbi:diaminopimelate epimerase [Paramagnetospirillum kuznetsovii]|uniref:Diaminopimelate epimerase n=1 Tax=Paramagnetospirillum kuznetsovii TaxID=2053833 RepID=A0A364P328_9PROT|nr:diaminopimelate epimerase [Paramagnetospirillum kuznetsovii]RAU23758.1 diaminopimelate epimerase [Paramagnetospirillum kuznetsovii]